MAISSLHHHHHHHHNETGPRSASTNTDTSSSSTSTDESSPSLNHPQQQEMQSIRQRQRQHSSSHDTPQRMEDEDDHDPLRWVDIDSNSDPDSTDDNNRNNIRQSNRRRQRPGRRSNNNTVKLQIPSFLCDCVSFFWDWTYAAVEIWMEVLVAPPFPLETLQKVSIILLGVERIRDNLDHHHSTGALNIVLVNSDGSPMTGGTGAWNLAALPHYLIWGIPGVIALLSISFVLTLQLSWGHQEEAVIATALILLIFLEALLPLFILGCTSMFLFQQVSWETGLVLLVVVWLGSTFCAHCIRRMLYQSLGHG